MEATFPQLAATALINISFAWIVGVLASRFWLRKQTAPWRQSAIRQLSASMAAALAFCAAGILLSLWTESALMGDVPWLDAWPVCRQMMATTHYGHAGLAAFGLLIAGMAAHRLLDRPGAGMAYIVSMSVVMLLLAAARVAIGHAFEHGPFSIAVALEWLHLLFMALWAGIVFVAGCVALPHMLAREAAPSAARAAYLASMSDWATAALAAILATGAYNAWRVLNGPRDLLAADYGNVLLLKMAMVLLAIALGGFNRLVGLPAARASQSGLRKVVAILRIESIVLLLVLMTAAVLSSSAPPGH